MSDKLERQISVYLDTVEDKKGLERDASRYGITISKLVKMALEVGKPIVVQSLRRSKRERREAVESITEKTRAAANEK